MTEAESWSIVQVAQISGVTSRTLRHYGEIGLLPPAYIGANGYRYYRQEQLLRLQQILVLRELDVPLSAIAEAIDSDPDTVVALRRHHGRLLAERDRLDRLANTVARTIADLEKKAGDPAPEVNRPANLFEGIDGSRYEDEARERWPEEFGSAQRFVATLTPDATARMGREMTAAMIRLAQFMAAGRPVADPFVQAEIDGHYRWICRFSRLTAGAYTNLGRMYVDDERFRSKFERIAIGMAEYQRDAMAEYARTRLR